MWNDRRLARRAARGDSDAFAAIFRRYQQDLYRYCVAILGDEQDAQDALQNTMVKALAALPGERRQIELKPWLYRVAHNESIELRRRVRLTAPLAEELPAPGAGPEQRADDRTRLRHLLADIGELPERHRAALVMRELAGLDFGQIGAALDTSSGAARQVVYEARRGLQRMSDGRDMECDAVTAILSDRDGRVSRRGDLRAHLRDCAECRRFATSIHRRAEGFAAISPLPALAAAAMIKGALSGGAGAAAGAAGAGGTAGAGAGTGVSTGAAAGGGASTGGAAVAGGAAAKVASTGAILKSAASIVAIVAVGTVAADSGHIFHGRGPATATPSAVAPTPSAAVPTQPERAAAERSAPTDMALADASTPERVDPARPTPAPAPRNRATPTVNVSSLVTAGPTAPASEDRPKPSGDEATTQPTIAPPTPSTEPTVARNEGHSEPHPVHPEHPEHSVHPVHPEHSVHMTRAPHPEPAAAPLAHPEHAEESSPPYPAHPPHPEHPFHPSTSEAAPSTVEPTEAESSETPTAAPEHPEHSEHPTHFATKAREPAPEAAAAAATTAEPEAVTETPTPSPSESAPGQAGKQAGD